MPSADPAPRAAASGGPSGGGFPTVTVRYGETAEVSVQGPVSGRAYRFSGAEPVQTVDARDAAVLVRHAAFQPA